MKEKTDLKTRLTCVGGVLSLALSAWANPILVGDCNGWDTKSGEMQSLGGGSYCLDITTSEKETEGDFGWFKILKGEVDNVTTLWEPSNTYFQGDSFTQMVDGANVSNGEGWNMPAAGKYRVTVNTDGMWINVQRIADSVSLDGDGTSLGEWLGRRLAFSYDESTASFSRQRVYLNADGAFKPYIAFNGASHYYGYADGGQAEITTGEYAMQVMDYGNDFKIDKSGYYNISVNSDKEGRGWSLSLSQDNTVRIGGAAVAENDDDWWNERVALVFNPATNSYEAKQMKFDAGQWFKLYYGSGEDGKDNVWGAEGNAAIGIDKRQFFELANVGDAGGHLYVEEDGYYDVAVKIVDGGLQIRLSSRGYYDGSVVNMPLKPADFADGKAHYFLVGYRTAAYRLQPEWEFKVADGWQIPASLLYNGYVMVAKVDNYADYVTQTYEAFSAQTESRIVSASGTEADVSVDLRKLSSRMAGFDGKFTSVRYNDLLTTSPDCQHGSWSALKKNAIYINPAEYDTDRWGEVKDDVYRLGGPSCVSAITLTLDNDGNPAKLTFNGLTNDAQKVAKLRTFTLVGGDIRNSEVRFDGDPTGDDVVVPNDHMYEYSNKRTNGGWGDGWIQYDDNARPYVDGHNEYVYYTSYTPDYMTKHPAYFSFPAENGNAAFEYNSKSITFVPDETQTHDNKFGQQWVKWVDNNGTIADDNSQDAKQEVVITYYESRENADYGRNVKPEDRDDNDTYTISNKMCYVVKDMWMKGQFKVWCGFSGAVANYDECDNGIYETRWYRDNGGHGAFYTDAAAYFLADKDVYFALFEDATNSNFGVGYENYNLTNNVIARNDWCVWDSNVNISELNPDRLYFNRVELWFDVDNCFVNNSQSASLIRFVMVPGSPNIWITRIDNSTIKYEYDIPLTTGTTDEVEAGSFGPVTSHKVVRVYVDSNGRETRTTVDEGNNESVSRSEFSRNNTDDKLLPGTYYYEITVTREKTGSVEYTAKSNEVYLDLTTGVENLSGNDEGGSLNIYPNPAVDIVNIVADDEIGGVEIYSVDGSLVRNAVISAAGGSVDVGSLPAGMYVLRACGQMRRLIIR